MKTLVLMSMLCCGLVAQAQEAVDLEDLGSATGQVDLSQLSGRVDDLTEGVNKHSEQITTLDERVKALEEKPSLGSSASTSPKLSSTLNPVSELRSGGWGSSRRTLSGGGSSGNAQLSSSYQPVSNGGGSNGGGYVQVSSSLLSAPLPRTPAPVQRREIVQMPVQKIVTENVSYAPVSSDCPGGVCPLNRSPALGSSLRLRSQQTRVFLGFRR